jgi:Transmembrane secretion effector
MGIAWTTSVALCNVCIQFAAPRWVAGRALAMFQVSMSGGLVAGSYLFGKLAEDVGLVESIVAAGVALVVFSALGRWLPMPERESLLVDGERSLPEPEVIGPVNGDIGPVAIMIEYDIPPERTQEFRRLMKKVRRMRLRNGAANWSVGRDLANVRLWIERYEVGTWHDYLRFRQRATALEQTLVESISALHTGPHTPSVRRWIEESELRDARDPII